MADAGTETDDVSPHSTPATTPNLQERDPDSENDGQGSSDDLLAELPDDVEEIELTHARLTTLAHLRLQRFAASLKRLCMRQNLLSSLMYDQEGEIGQVCPLESLTALEDLDLYDNRLPTVDGLTGLSALQSLDLSFNLLRKVPTNALASMTRLRTLYLIQNKISRIEGLEPLADTLEYVEFGGNKLRTIEGLSSLTNLTQLWLGKNKITKLDNLSTLVNLKTLSIQSNRITVIENLEKLTKLEELYLSHNGLTTLGGLEQSLNLRVLDVAGNRIASMIGVSHLSKLEEFWANNNEIAAFSEVESELAPLKKLQTVYLEGNPLEKDLGTAYRRRITMALPNLEQLDATYVKQSS